MVTIHTIGHSTRSLKEFLSVLSHYGIELLADIRSYPSSRRFPHFNQEALKEALSSAGIDYVWFKELGGRRHGQPAEDSPDQGLRSAGFRNYADHMLTGEFQTVTRQLRDLAGDRRVVLMCAERLYRRCHRRLVADYLTAQGDEVLHIESADRLLPHRLTPGARLEGDRVTYPAEEKLF